MIIAGLIALLSMLLGDNDMPFLLPNEEKSIKKVLVELAELQFLYEVEDGVFGLNMHYMFTMLSGRGLLDDLERQVQNSDMEVEIVRLKKEIVDLKREVKILKISNKSMSYTVL